MGFTPGSVRSSFWMPAVTSALRPSSPRSISLLPSSLRAVLSRRFDLSSRFVLIEEGELLSTFPPAVFRREAIAGPAMK